jgi:hypothetical protein
VDDSVQAALEESIGLLRSGRTVDECVALHPEADEEELRPLLEAIVALEAQARPVMPAAARLRVRNRVLDEWDRNHRRSERRWRLPSFTPRWIAVPAAAFLLMALSGVGGIAAASAAVPGETLYPIKEFSERARLWLSLSDEAKVGLSAQLVRERAEEVRELVAAERTDPAAIAHAVDRMGHHLAVLEEAAVASQATQPSVSAGTGEVAEAAVILQASLEQAPAAAQPQIQDALAAVQQARSRVYDAVHSLESGTES